MYVFSTNHACAEILVHVHCCMQHLLRGFRYALYGIYIYIYTVYVIYKSWLSGVLRVYTMQTSDDRGFEGRIYAQYTT